MIRLVLYDDREDSSTYGELQEIYMGEDNYCLVIIPPFIWNGYLVVGNKTAILANCPTQSHNPDEMLRMDPYSDKIPYDWAIKMR